MKAPKPNQFRRIRAKFNHLRLLLEQTQRDRDEQRRQRYSAQLRVEALEARLRLYYDGRSDHAIMSDSITVAARIDLAAFRRTPEVLEMTLDSIRQNFHRTAARR